MQSFISFCQWLWSFIGGFGGLVGVAGGVCGVIALFQTGKANQLAKDANELAESANGEAGAANELAENANKIALDANEVAKRSLRVGADQTVYDWTVGVEDDGRTIVLVTTAHMLLTMSPWLFGLETQQYSTPRSIM